MRFGNYQRSRMSSCKRFFLLKICMSFITAQFLFIQAQYSFAAPPVVTDPAYWNMNSAISGITQQALQNRGYVANDPRTYATLQGMSSTASSVAGSVAATVAGAALVTAAGITAPAWGSILLVATVSSVVGLAVQLGIQGLINWYFRSDKKLDISSGSSPIPTCSLGGVSHWYATYGSPPITIYGCDGLALAMQAYTNKFGSSAGTPVTCVDSVTVFGCNSTAGGANSFRVMTAPPLTCPAGSYLNGTQCVLYSYPPQPLISSATSQTLQQAVNTIPQTELNKPLNPQLVASLANTLWQQAASQPGYAGFPYPASNPISTAEAQTWQQANPAAWPTVGNFVAPVPTNTTPSSYALPSNPTQPFTTPTTNPNPAVTNPASSNTLQNLGPDPATPAPTLEPTPTAQSIIQPILNLLPDLKNYHPSITSGQCPRPTLNLFGSTQTLESHCKVFEDNKLVIRSAMILAFTMAALFIVLSA